MGLMSIKGFQLLLVSPEMGPKKTKEFTMDLESLFEFKEWVIGNGCMGHRLRRLSYIILPFFTRIMHHLDLIRFQD